MKKKYTPGSWALFNVNGVLQVDNRDGDGASPCVVHWRGFDGNDVDSDENEANAHLISAAPDLLEALEGLMEAAEFADMNQSPTGCYENEIAAARAAIAKAYGEGE
jgi:hypothetical protein